MLRSPDSILAGSRCNARLSRSHSLMHSRSAVQQDATLQPARAWHVPAGQSARVEREREREYNVPASRLIVVQQYPGIQILRKPRELQIASRASTCSPTSFVPRPSAVAPPADRLPQGLCCHVAAGLKRT